LAEGLPHQNHIQITINQLVCFHKNKFDGMICKEDSNETSRPFKHPRKTKRGIPNPTRALANHERIHDDLL